MTLKEAYAWLFNLLKKRYDEREARNITAIVFEDVFKGERFAKGNFSQSDEEHLKNIGQRLEKMEPLQYVLGEADFYGLKFLSDRRALIPRPETEELVHQIIKDLRKIDFEGNGIRLLDIGTGTGCIPLTIKHHLRKLEAHGLDVSPEALSLAKENGKELGLDMRWHHLSILEQANWTKLPEFDVIVSNPPYIPSTNKGSLAKNVVEYEPGLALFVYDTNPLLFYEAITDFALEKLNDKGKLYFEINEYYGEEVLFMMADKGMQNVEILTDMQGKDRMVIASL